MFENLHAKAAEYHDLFWFEVLGRIPVVGGRLRDFRSNWNYRRD